MGQEGKEILEGIAVKFDYGMSSKQMPRDSLHLVEVRITE